MTDFGSGGLLPPVRSFWYWVGAVANRRFILGFEHGRRRICFLFGIGTRRIDDSRVGNAVVFR